MDETTVIVDNFVTARYGNNTLLALFFPKILAFAMYNLFVIWTKRRDLSLRKPCNCPSFPAVISPPSRYIVTNTHTHTREQNELYSAILNISPCPHPRFCTGSAVNLVPVVIKAEFGKPFWSNVLFSPFKSSTVITAVHLSSQVIHWPFNFRYNRVCLVLQNCMTQPINSFYRNWFHCH